MTHSVRLMIVSFSSMRRNKKAHYTSPTPPKVEHKNANTNPHKPTPPPAALKPLQLPRRHWIVKHIVFQVVHSHSSLRHDLFDRSKANL